MINSGPKLVKLHMGHLIGPNELPLYDFCHTKNLKFVPPFIIRCGHWSNEMGEMGNINHVNPLRNQKKSEYKINI